MSDETRKRVAGAVREPQSGAYRAVLADPPWRSQQTGRFGAVQHYALMSDERILGLGAAVREVAAEQSFCFLWVTTATVPLGIRSKYETR